MSTSTITITVRYFAMMRELLGTSESTMVLDTGATARDAFAQVAEQVPRIAGMDRAVMVMVNEEYVSREHVLQHGDEVAFIPPVSGGANRLFLVTEDELDPRAVEACVAGPDVGALVTFTGTVRDTARDLDVTQLEYEAYAPAAEKMLARVAEEVIDQWPEVRTAIHHRTGTLGPGEASVVIACASPHREAAFHACSFAIARIKEIVPIWKKEHYADDSVWIGSEVDYQKETGRIPS